MKKKYTVVRDLIIDGKSHIEGETVSLTDEDAASRLERGSIVEAVKEPSEPVSPSPAPDKKDSKPSKAERSPSIEKIESMKVEAKADKKAHKVAEPITNEERNFHTGENIVGVNSPDPIVGETVPVDLVMPGQVVDPRTGRVLEGGGHDLSTPQPLAPSTYAQSLPEIRRANKRARELANAGGTR